MMGRNKEQENKYGMCLGKAIYWKAILAKDRKESEMNNYAG